MPHQCLSRWVHKAVSPTGAHSPGHIAPTLSASPRPRCASPQDHLPLLLQTAGEISADFARLEWERLVLTRDRSNADERKSGEADFLLQPELST